MRPVIVVHGGAGDWKIGSDRLDEAWLACFNAATVGQRVLLNGGSAVDAVEAAVRVLEDSPVCDAGRGSYLNTNGDVELDALIMDGATMELGAVAAVQLIQNPITLARHVMLSRYHSFLVGAGAEAFADSIGMPRCDKDSLITDEQLAIYRELKTGAIRKETEPLQNVVRFGDTVGAVAIDTEGNVAAATSTGGTKGKLPGRVGDSPLVGSGGYADNWTGAVSATGHGESLMKVVISKRVCDFIAQGLSAQKACEAAIGVLVERVNGKGGVIAIDMRGRPGIAYNTTAMPAALAIGDEPVIRHSGVAYPG